MFSIDVVASAQTTHVFADSRIGILCHALRICVAQANLVLLSCLYAEPFELVTEIATAPRLPATKLICSNVHSRAAALSASMMLLCCSLASCSFTSRKSSFLSDDRLNSRMYGVRRFLLIRLTLCHPSSDSKNDFHKTFSGQNHGVPFVHFHRNRFFNFYRLFRQRFSAAYLLKLFLLPQRVHTTLFIRCDNPELTR